MQDFEKLGLFYMGREYDLKKGKLKENLVLYDSKDLVTHAVCVGMTGSGKTGLCMALLEEAAIDSIPAIVIDPKGDLTNLLLTFPQLRGEDFAPWINEDDARKKGLGPQEYGAQQAEMWKAGLADWGQSGERIQRLRDAVELTVYTPGSSAGVPVSILKSFAAPDASTLEDGELLRERIGTMATSLLGLMGIDADPIQSREHILLSNIIAWAWRKGQDLDLAALIQYIQNPPLTKIGVLDLEMFYPSKDRFELVMALNNLLASPGFSAWLEGDPLDINQILYTAGGRPRIAIFSIAHLSDAERMFFVSLLLNQTLGWMRGQSGTTSLRALLYMDEIFGYFPPTANPPSKKPLLTLLKQARAFGLGILLATQNPVDLDYKGLSNAGTWLIGRLQTERDKARVLEGLEGASASAGSKFDRGAMEQTLAGLGNRIFLMNNTHEDAPVILQTRWALSYLRGPLTRSQIKTLMDPIKAARESAAPAGRRGAATGLAAAPAATAMAGGSPAARPSLPSEVPQFFIPARGRALHDSSLLYRPMVLGAAKVNFVDAKTKVDVTQDVVSLTAVTDEAVPVTWEDARDAAVAVSDLEKSPQEGAKFADLPSAAGKAKNYAAWSKSLVAWLYGTQKLDLLRSGSTGLFSQQGESERDFRVRLQQSARERRDAAAEELRKKYAAKQAALQERRRVAQQKVGREADQAKQAQLQTAISVGTTLLSAFVGRKAVSASTLGRASTAVRGVGRSMKEHQDIGRAEDTVEAVDQRLADLEAELRADMDALEAKLDAQTEQLETISIKPKKTNIAVQLVALAWAPFRVDAQGAATAAWE